MVDDPEDPSDRLRTLTDQRLAVQRAVTVDPLVCYLPWGLATLLGFGAVFLHQGPHGTALVTMPSWCPPVTLAGGFTLAAVISSVVPARAARQIVGRSSSRGAIFGASWGLAFVGIAATTNRFADHLPADQGRLLWSCLSVAAVALLFMTGSAIFEDRPLFWFGAWLVFINIGGVYAGPGWHPLVIAAGGGGGLIVLGAWQSARYRRLLATAA